MVPALGGVHVMVRYGYVFMQVKGIAVRREAVAMHHLTRDEALAKLGGDPGEASRLLDQAPQYPHHTRTNFHLITRYPAGPVWHDGKIIGQHPGMWVVSSW